MGQQEAADTSECLDIAIVGAGFAGLFLLQRLRSRGLRVRAFEAESDIGGVWHAQRYPGIRVDSAGIVYQYSDPSLWRDWSYSQRYPAGAEVKAYFDYVDGKYGLRRDIEFNTRIVAARFDDATNRWSLGFRDGGAAQARFVILCTGIASKPYIPAIDGLEDFAGPSHHTARWPKEGLGLAGKRIGVIGTGASGVQVIQEAAKTASHLTVFQRTPNMALPMRQEPNTSLDGEAQKKRAASLFAKTRHAFGGFEFTFQPKATCEDSEADRQANYQRLWDEGGLAWWLGNYNDLIVSERANRATYAFWRDKTRARIDNPVNAEKLAPKDPPHPFGVKRPSLEQNYFEIFNQQNVTLVDLNETPIERINRSGIRTSTTQIDLDILVLATGFDAISGSLTSIDVAGTGGKRLKQSWASGIRTHLGMAAAGFPNLLFVSGPQSPSAFCNGPTCAELQGGWMAAFLCHLKEKCLRRFEATTEAQEAWRKRTLRLAARTLLDKADSWYMGANIPGKTRELQVYPAGLPSYLAKCRECAEQGYSGFTLS
ncbi:MAG: NAD(P)/FAD-dependent oxidoreductase [Pseudomonadota bacterium]